MSPPAAVNVATPMLSTEPPQARAATPKRPQKAAARTNTALQMWLAHGTVGVTDPDNNSPNNSNVSSPPPPTTRPTDSWRDSAALPSTSVYPDLAHPAYPPTPIPSVVPLTPTLTSSYTDAPSPLHTQPTRLPGWDTTNRSYTSSHWSEISLSAGQDVLVWAVLSDGWCVGAAPTHSGTSPPNTAGLFPTSHLSTPYAFASRGREVYLNTTRAAFLSGPGVMAGLNCAAPGTEAAKRDFFLRALASGLVKTSERGVWIEALEMCSRSTGLRDGDGVGKTLSPPLRSAKRNPFHIPFAAPPTSNTTTTMTSKSAYPPPSATNPHVHPPGAGAGPFRSGLASNRSTGSTATGTNTSDSNRTSHSALYRPSGGGAGMVGTGGKTIGQKIMHRIRASAETPRGSFSIPKDQW
ncbi:uncharacterized protein EV422DRAFT_546112 [Fimicolochytrium jonesii]|uniref:uncharacterized protein n=1 Tax=Fimicolochytrium jonesii TaxID=1396493 RepID=UPI0022FF3C59|nr:uncharacterized protein EV422DRAFT_546112 [Fimicolochytrium jonesii]KAI8816283.1 hypothetical protein EV422DRAFT_546112 [Fimicolochytrium jonesii]